MMRLPMMVVLLGVAVGACGSRTEARPADVPPPAPPPPPIIVDTAWGTLQVCVVDGEGMRMVQVEYSTVTGDSLVDGRPFSEVYPTTAAYAEGAEWYINNEPIEIDSILYTKYGLPRELRPGELVRRRDYRGVMMFTGAEDAGTPYEVWYAAVRPGCEFHPYQWDLLVGIRG
jgi:hypothetical protein